MWAHSGDGNGRWHRLSAHARSTAALSSRFAREFGAEDLGYALGLFHDAGKAARCWQEGLAGVADTGKSVGVPHKEAGAGWLAGLIGPVSLAILGHHGGLASAGELTDKLEAFSAGAFGDLEQVQAEFLREVPEAQEVLQRGGLVPQLWREDPLLCELGIRLAFSALVDADHLDTAAHFAGWDAPRVRADTDMVELAALFEQQRQRMLTSRRESGASPIDAIRERVYQRAIEHALGPTGVYRMPAPTGVGKTLAAAGFGLRHAAHHGKRRVIVAVPFITVTEQNAGVYRGLLGNDNVLEHHSAVTASDDRKQQIRQHTLAENWDSPVVVTTTVQLFHSLFGRKPMEMRKVHRLANSVIVLDEVQALPLRVLIPILNVLRMLSEHFNTTVLLTSATQPSFEHLGQWADLTVTDIVDDPASLYRSLRRVEYEWWLDPRPGLLEVADHAAQHEQVLVVVNTIADARTIYQHWAESDPESVWHLSTRMCPAHRRTVLTTVRDRLTRGERVRLVSTQLIEAGVDIDLPIVYRAMAPAEALQQAAGRANREGHLEGNGKVVVFDAHDMSSPSGYRAGTDVTRQHFGPSDQDTTDPDNLAALADYYRDLYRTSNTENGARNRAIQENRVKLDYIAVTNGPMHTAPHSSSTRDPKRAFRMLDDDTIPAIIPDYDHKATTLLDRLKRAPEEAGQLIRALQPYIVALPQRLLEDDAVSAMCQPIFGDLHAWKGDYNTAYGIDTSNLINEEVW
ncbi:CRISPR-associated helicase Cas3' [Saccharopolyspora endophytica]|uniref:CRISPR-associated helicase Cas3' n=1 Tax=Saccharopolyspora endophytica TaxID=543886 RepID=UPI002484A4FB|nr:CRISPR-associated helicase Cas3' [Saccharopolyspora endophytica]